MGCLKMASEKRLIDANVLLEDFGEEPMVWNDGEAEIQERNDWHRYKNIVESQPTVDAVEVVHGNWVSLTECANAGVYCSVCNKKVFKEDYAWCNRKNKLRSNYCPNCGAKMDGGNEDEMQ